MNLRLDKKIELKTEKSKPLKCNVLALSWMPYTAIFLAYGELSLEVQYPPENSSIKGTNLPC